LFDVLASVAFSRELFLAPAVALLRAVLPSTQVEVAMLLLNDFWSVPQPASWIADCFAARVGSHDHPCDHVERVLLAIQTCPSSYCVPS
jgi:hypothetical protein